MTAERPSRPVVLPAPWVRSVRFMPVSTGEVHLWGASVLTAAPAMTSLLRLLDATERSRSERFHFERDRDRFVVAHGLKRLVLGRCTGVAPSALRFATGSYGKPALITDGPHLEFNMSDSGDIVLVAVALGVAVGVDAEARTSDMDDAELTSVAVTAFSPAERAALARARTPDRRRVFFDTWSRKEAYLKATGDGVTLGLDHFDVSADEHDARLIADRRELGAADRWGMGPLDLGDDFSSALAWDRLACTSALVVRTHDAQTALLGEHAP